jgi:hypothetical protein
MSKFEKAIARLLAKPKDFTWKELKTVLGHFGYQEKRQRIKKKVY